MIYRWKKGHLALTNDSYDADYDRLVLRLIYIAVACDVGFTAKLFIHLTLNDTNGGLLSPKCHPMRIILSILYAPRRV